jgi:NMD protein affecting ribosome stability and mRNA decay
MDNTWNPELRVQIPCRICGQQTPHLFTKLCDRCWELETRIQADPLIAGKIMLSGCRNHGHTRRVSAYLG